MTLIFICLPLSPHNGCGNTRQHPKIMGDLELSLSLQSLLSVGSAGGKVNGEAVATPGHSYGGSRAPLGRCIPVFVQWLAFGIEEVFLGEPALSAVQLNLWRMFFVYLIEVEK